jgi:hypothetical protein
MTGKHTMHKAFSLLELLLVIFIVSLVYFLGFEGVDKMSTPKERLTALSLKKVVTHLPQFTGKGTFMCIDRCRSCYLREGIDTPFEKVELPIALAGLKVYRIDESDNLQEMEFGRYQDNKICLLMHFYPNGSSSQLILETDDEVYFLPAYFGEPQKTASLTKAQDLWLQHAHDLDDRGDFY